MSSSAVKRDWTKPAAMAIPEGGFPDAERALYQTWTVLGKTALLAVDSRAESTLALCQCS